MLERVSEHKRTISWIIRHKDDFKVDKTYQRELVWTRDLQQYLIDSILKGYDISRIYVWVKNGKYYVIDGQQRLNAIWEFAENAFPLSSKYSKDRGSLYYRNLPTIPPSDNLRDRFDETNVTIVFLSNFIDEEVRDVFRRVNSGVPLNVAERLNAYPGEIVVTARKMAEHPFFEKITDITSTRYRYLHLSAQLMMLEKEGIMDISPSYLYYFFDKNEDLSTDSDIYRRLIGVLDYLLDSFKSKTLELGKPSWVITLYLLTSYLLKNYVMKGRGDALKKFFVDFYQKVLKSTEFGDRELIEFDFAISRGTTSQRNIKFRHDVILRDFLICAKDLVPIDPKRAFTKEERVAVFRRDGGRCQGSLPSGEIHNIELSMDNFHVHHIKPWSEGGKTTLENAMLVCEECHKRLPPW